MYIRNSISERHEIPLGTYADLRFASNAVPRTRGCLPFGSITPHFLVPHSSFRRKPDLIPPKYTPFSNMEAVRFHGLCNVKHDTGVTRPSPKAGQVGIQVRRVGICGSDVHVWKQDYGSELPYPLICGHEGAGIITELGEGVSGFQVGDRVCMEPTPPQAFDMVAEFYCHPAAKTFKLPDDISLDEGAMAEPWAVAVHAVKRAGVEKGDNVLVLGAGPVGQLSMVAAKVFGAARTVVTDIKPARLKTVELFGADAMVLVDGLSPAEAAAKAKEQFQNGEIDVVIDGVGGEASLAVRLGAKATSILPIFRALISIFLSIFADGVRGSQNPRHGAHRGRGHSLPENPVWRASDARIDGQGFNL